MAEPKYAIRTVKVEIIIINSNAASNPFVELIMITSIARILDIMMAWTGVPLLFCLLKIAGNR